MVPINLRNILRRSAVYGPWRKYREWQQSTAFNTVLDNYLSTSDRSLTYSFNKLIDSLAELRSQRRPWPGQDQLPQILGFGTQDWEQYGLWPTFQSISDFTFFDYGERKSLYGASPSPLLRDQLMQEFLSIVDKADKKHPVNLCFFYADSAYIAPTLLDALAQRGIWSVVMGLDDKHRFYERDGYGMRVGQVTLAPHADLMWTTWRIGADIFLAAGGRPWYAPPAADPNFYQPIDCERDLEMVFIGQSYGARADLVRFLIHHGFHVSAFGAGWPSGYISQEEMVRLYSRAQVVLGVGGVQSMEGVQHLKGRDFEVPMCGALYLTSYNPELCDWFNIGQEVLCYSSPENCAEVLHWVLRQPGRQAEIRKAALKRSLSEHTWKKRLQQMFSILGNNTYGKT